MNNKLIEELYNKIDNQEKIIRELQEENKQLKEVRDEAFKIVVSGTLEFRYYCSTNNLGNNIICYRLTCFPIGEKLKNILKGEDNE